MFVNNNTNNLGLFGQLGASAVVSDLKLDGFTVRNAAGAAGTSMNIGMLAGMSAGTIRNVHVVGGTVSTPNTTTGISSAGVAVGGFVGSFIGGTITSCSSSASVINANPLNTANTHTGGFIGYSSGAGPVTYCYAAGNVSAMSSAIGGFIGHVGVGGTVFESCYATGEVAGYNNIGGFAGLLATGAGAVLNRCFARGATTGYSSVGGLVGQLAMGNTANQSYSSGAVKGFSSLGGLIGNSAGVVTASYWDTEMSGMATSNGGSGRTSAQMRVATTFTSWNFTSDWAEGIEAPYLRACGRVLRTDIDVDRAYLLTVELPTLIHKTTGEVLLGMDCFGAGPGVTDVTSVEDIRVDQDPENEKIVRRRFHVAPGTSVTLYATCENMFANASVGAFDGKIDGATTYTLLGVDRLQTHVMRVGAPLENALPSNPEIVGRLPIIAEFKTKVRADASTDVFYMGTGADNTGSWVGYSCGNAIGLGTVRAMLMVQKLIDMELDGITNYNTQIAPSLDPTWTYASSIEYFIAAHKVDAARMPRTYTPANRKAVCEFVATAHYMQDNNIILPSEFSGLGNALTPFRGYYDGAKWDLSLDIKTTGTAPLNAAGLFRYLGIPNDQNSPFCLVRNVQIYGSVQFETAFDYGFVGALAGYVAGPHTLMKGCTSFASVSGLSTRNARASKLFVGGLCGIVMDAPIMATANLSDHSTASEVAMDSRLSVKGYGIAVTASSTYGSVYAGGGYGSVIGSYMRGANITLEQSVLEAAGGANTYAGGAVGLFQNTGFTNGYVSNTTIRGCYLLGNKNFTIYSRSTNIDATNGADAVAAGIAGWIDKTGLGTVNLSNNTVDTDAMGVGSGRALIQASDSTAMSVANIYAAGFYGKLNPDASQYYSPGFLVGQALSRGATLLNGDYDITAIQNGRAGANREPMSRNSVYYAQYGNVYAGGVIGSGMINLKPGTEAMIKGVDVKAVQKNTAANAGGNVGTTAVAGRVTAGLLSGAYDRVGLPFTLDGLNVHAHKSSVHAIREPGSPAQGALCAGGLIGAVGRYHDINWQSTNTANDRDISMLTIKDLWLVLTDCRISGEQLSYNSVPGNISELFRNDNRANVICGGIVGGGYKIELLDNTVFSSTTPRPGVTCPQTAIEGIQNGQGTSDMPTCDVYIGGAIGFGAYSTIRNVSVMGENPGDFEVLMQANNGCNSPSVGGIIGYLSGGKYITDATLLTYPTAPTSRELGIRDCHVKNLKIHGENYYATSASNFDVLIGGVLGFMHCPATNTNPTMVLNSTVEQCTIAGRGRAWSLAKVGGISGAQYHAPTNGGTAPMIERCISRNNTISVESQKTRALAGGILGEQFNTVGTNSAIVNCLSLNNVISAYSSESISAVGGIVGGQGANHVTYLRYCFSNSTLMPTNAVNANIRRGGLMGYVWGSISVPTSMPSYFHQENAGTADALGGYLSIGSPTLPGWALEFPSLVLAAPYGNTVAKSVLTTTVPANALKQTVVGGYDSDVTYAHGAPLSTVSHAQQFSNVTPVSLGGAYANLWNIVRKPLANQSTFADSWLWIAPWPGAPKEHFGTLSAVVTFEEAAPTALSVDLFAGENTDDTSSTVIGLYSDVPPGQNTSNTITYRDDAVYYTAFTEVSGHVEDHDKEANPFHKVKWEFYDSDALGNISTKLPNQGSLSMYCQMTVEPNRLTIDPSVPINLPKTFYFRAVDYLTDIPTKVSPFVRMTIDPIYITDLTILPLYGTRDKTDPTGLGTIGNPYLVVPNTTQRLFATIAPLNAPLQGSVFDGTTTGIMTVYPDGTVVIPAGASTSLPAMPISSSSDGAMDASGAKAKDTIYIQVVPPVPVSFDNINNSARVTGATYTIANENFDYYFTSRAGPAKSVHPRTKLPRKIRFNAFSNNNYTLPLGSEDMVVQGIWVAQPVPVIRYLDDVSSATIFDVISINDYVIDGAVLSARYAGVRSIRVEIEYYDTNPVVFHLQTSGIQPQVLLVPVTFKVSDIAALNDPILNPKRTGYDFRGWLNLPNPTAKIDSSMMFNIEADILGPVQYYARWQNQVEYMDLGSDPTELEMPWWVLAIEGMPWKNAPVDKSEDFPDYPNADADTSYTNFIYHPQTQYMNLTFDVTFDAASRGRPAVYASIGDLDPVNVGEPVARINPDPVTSSPGVFTFSFDNATMQATADAAGTGKVKIKLIQLAHDIFTTASVGGRISPRPTKGVIHLYDQDVTFSARAEDGYELTHIVLDSLWPDEMKEWSAEGIGALLDMDGYYTIPYTYSFKKVEVDRSLEAFFRLRRYTLSMNHTLGGTVKVNDVPWVNGQSGEIIHTHTPDILMTPDAVAGKEIKKVEMRGRNTDPIVPYTPAQLGAPRDLYGNYTVPFLYEYDPIETTQTMWVTYGASQFDLYGVANANGTVTPASQQVEWMQSGSVTITPNYGFQISTVRIDELDGAGTVLNTVTKTAEEAGAVTDGRGYYVNPLDYTLTNVEKNYRVTATFTLNAYTVTPSVVGGGAVAPDTPRSVNHFANAGPFTYTPNNAAGYQTESLTIETQNGDGTWTSVIHTPTQLGWAADARGYYTAARNYTASSVTTNMRLIGSYVLRDYTVTPSVAGNIGGSISPNLAEAVTHGDDSSTFTMTPLVADGYEFDTITVTTQTLTNTWTSVAYSPSAFGAVKDSNGFYTLPVDYAFEDVQFSHTLVPKYRLRTYTVLGTTGANGTITPQGYAPVTWGTDITFKFVPNQFYELDTVTFDGAAVTPVAVPGERYNYTYTVSNVREFGHEVSVTYKRILVQVAAQIAGPPDGTPNVNTAMWRLISTEPATTAWVGQNVQLTVGLGFAYTVEYANVTSTQAGNPILLNTPTDATPYTFTDDVAVNLVNPATYTATMIPECDSTRGSVTPLAGFTLDYAAVSARTFVLTPIVEYDDLRAFRVANAVIAYADGTSRNVTAELVDGVLPYEKTLTLTEAALQHATLRVTFEAQLGAVHTLLFMSNNSATSHAKSGWSLIRTDVPSAPGIMTWSKPDDTIKDLPFGRYMITFRPVTGYYNPRDTVEFVVNKDYTIPGNTYEKDATYYYGMGSIVVNCPGPSDGSWTLYDSTGTNVVENQRTKQPAQDLKAGELCMVHIGSYLVKFGTVAHWDKPANTAVAITQTDQMRTLTLPYVAHIGYFSVVVDAPPIGAGYRIAGMDGTFAIGGTLNLNVGEYVVSFVDVVGYVTPATQTVKVTKDATTTLNAEYVKAQEPVRVGDFEVTYSGAGTMPTVTQVAVVIEDLGMFRHPETLVPFGFTVSGTIESDKTLTISWVGTPPTHGIDTAFVVVDEDTASEGSSQASAQAAGIIGRLGYSDKVELSEYVAGAVYYIGSYTNSELPVGVSSFELE